MDVLSKRKIEDEGSESLVVSKKAKREDAGAIIEFPTGDVKDGRLSSLTAPTMQLIGHESEVNGLDFSPDGNTLASCSFDRTIVLWNVRDEECAATTIMRGHKSSISDIKWLQAGDYLVTSSADKTAALWDAVTAQRIKQFKGHASYVNAVAVSRRETSEPWKIATASDDRTARIWDKRVKGRKATQTLDHAYQLLALDFGSDENQLYTGGIDNSVYAWDLRKPEKEVMRLAGHENTITGLSVNKAGTHLVTNGMDNVCKVWDIRPYVEGGDDNRLTMNLTGHQIQVEKNLVRCAWSPDGTTVACGSGDRMVWVWNGVSGEVLYKLPGHRGSVNDVAFHPTEPIIGSASSDKTIFLGELRL
mmetsp:Transcript_40370/g.160308  ORF Transcript_40370/g.160308 Transcript_40370/m.160308 type:complete len:361 (-) Transcript_40370:2367-3449(-)|eukprot:CAMPEP_0113973442 /NCGR_PEP_ID=MMETSP0011_2-20120614/14491_1 /TAXON_ID=101924 /ORGANISM="Rhodosorus marinus" /LENGTH=360 /DNA_ID=CAMNT_0000991443 /DNA_START=34 /DNA_END=1116 /DNA_ORIENTATION=- /assembly_acc=CAM_ASM_000156